MSELHIPFHQIEIRFKPLLDFDKFGRSLLAPYARLASSFTIQNSGTIEERISFGFKEPLYSIFVQFDRIFLKTEGGIDDLVKLNSIIESPFLDIFAKLQAHSSYTMVVNALFIVRCIRTLDVTDSYEHFSHAFISKESTTLVPGTNDLAIVFARNSEENIEEESVTIGPFKYETDIKKRKELEEYSRITDLKELSGLMCEYKLFAKLGKFTLSDYSNMHTKYSAFLSKFIKL